MADIIVVGAGPVGLWTAIQLKLRLPSLDIVMLEKYTEYQRSHTVNIEQSAHNGSYADPTFQKLIKPFVGLIPTKQIEETLKNYAQKLGINIKYEQVKSCQTLSAQYPEAKIIIGADGAHSIVRKDIFEDKKTNQNLQYIAEIKYEVTGNSRSLSSWSEVYNPLLKVNHLVTEHVGKTSQQKTPITLRVVVDKNTYQTIKQATFKTPYQWTTEDKKKMDPKLVQTIDIWLKERQCLLGDKIVDNSLKISSLELNAYNSEQVVDQKYDKQWILVGDAAFGVPYFRSLNNGLRCGSELAEKIIATLQNQPKTLSSSLFNFGFKKTESALQSYSDFVRDMARYETLMAKLKTGGINALNSHLAGVKTLLGIGIFGEQEKASIPTRLMVLGFTAMTGAYLCSKLASTSNKENNNRELPSTRSSYH